MFCIHTLLNIIFLTVPQAVGLGNELSKSTVISVYKVIDDMRASKIKPDSLSPLFLTVLPLQE